jgi:Cdc6-like AAA superfamily ATPase
MFLHLCTTYKSFRFFSLISLVILSGSLCADTGLPTKTTTLNGLEGTFPATFRYVMKQLKDSGDALKTGKPLPEALCKNCLLLYGPSGSGKTTIAKKIAEQAGAHCIHINFSELMSKYQGESVANLRGVFEDADEYVNKNNQPVVIVLDNVDLHEPEERPEFLAFSQELCYLLDKIREDSRFFVIAVTNKEELHFKLKTHFGVNIEKINALKERLRQK